MQLYFLKPTLLVNQNMIIEYGKIMFFQEHNSVGMLEQNYWSGIVKNNGLIARLAKHKIFILLKFLTYPR